MPAPAHCCVAAQSGEGELRQFTVGVPSAVTAYDLKQLLLQDVVTRYGNERAHNCSRIARPKGALALAALHIGEQEIEHGLNLLRTEVPKQAVSFQCGMEHQPQKLRIREALVQNAFDNRAHDAIVVVPGAPHAHLLDPQICARLRGFEVDDRRVERLLRCKVLKDDGFRHTCSGGNLSGCRARKAVPGEQPHRRPDQLPTSCRRRHPQSSRRGPPGHVGLSCEHGRNLVSAY